MTNRPIPDEVQHIQTAYRRRILDCWNIPLGSRILEIGCGQGDMTAVLAEAVGPTGRIIATDIAGRECGSPL
ncbi:MAG: class I SAM-dependent methyltransferase, partial [Armatimonadota bacterium]